MATIPSQAVTPALPPASGQGTFAPSDQAFPQSGRQWTQQSPMLFQDLLAKSQSALPTQSARASSNTAGSTPSSDAKTKEIAHLSASELQMDVSRSLITQQASQSLASNATSHIEQHVSTNQPADQLQTANQHTNWDSQRAHTSKTRSESPGPSAHQQEPTAFKPTSNISAAHDSISSPAAQLQSSPLNSLDSLATNAEPRSSPASLLRASAGTTLSLANHGASAPSISSNAPARASALEASSAPRPSPIHTTFKSNTSASSLQSLVSKKPQLSHQVAQQESTASSLSKLSQSLAEALRTGGQLSFRISPGSMGAISISLTPHDEGPPQTTAQLAAEPSSRSASSLFDLTLIAADPAAAQTLRDEINSLRTSLEQKGITIASIKIHAEQTVFDVKQAENSMADNRFSHASTGQDSSSRNPNDQSNQRHPSSHAQSSNHSTDKLSQPNQHSLDLGAPSGTSLATLLPLIRAGLARLDAVV